VTLYDSRINGEFLGWHTLNLRLVRCQICGSQPLCYATSLILEDCTCDPDADQTFEYSDVQATVRGHVTSIKNPRSGFIKAGSCGELILDGDGDPIPLFHIDSNGHLIYTFYGVDGQAHATLDIGDVRGLPLTWDDLTEAQKASLKGETGASGAQGPKGDPLTWNDLTPEQKAAKIDIVDLLFNPKP
jgi:hypothetical protein